MSIDTETAKIAGRLKLARIRAGYKTAKDFYGKHKIAPATYTHHEVGKNKMDIATVKKYSTALKIELMWLLTGSSPSPQPEYVLNVGHSGADRLDLLHSLHAKQSYEWFAKEGITQGSIVADIGCGTGLTTAMIANYVGNNGVVHAFDSSKKQLSIAHSKVCQEGLNNVKFYEKRVEDLSEFANEFDFVYFRCLLHHVKDPALAVKTMLKILKPGGMLIGEEPIMTSCWHYPELPAYDKAFKIYGALLRRNNTDPEMGKKLHKIFYDTGELKDLKSFCYSPSCTTVPNKLMVEMLITECYDQIVENKLATAKELDAISEELRASCASDDMIMIYPTVIQVKGKKK